MRCSFVKVLQWLGWGGWIDLLTPAGFFIDATVSRSPSTTMCTGMGWSVGGGVQHFLKWHHCLSEGGGVTRVIRGDITYPVRTYTALPTTVYPLPVAFKCEVTCC